MRYRIGVDVGDRSIGLAAIEYDEAGSPIRILAAVSHIHDGGMDPETAKSPLSRTATSGVARRTRRLVRNRRRRLARLDQLLLTHGYVVPEEEIGQTHDAWSARARLSKEYELNDKTRINDLSLCIRHIARHRGWRNPWWKWSTLRDSEGPTDKFVSMQASAAERFGPEMLTCDTLGQLVIQIASSGVPVRATKQATARGVDPLMSNQIMQVDSLFELRTILVMQKVPTDVIDLICAEVFSQEAPHIPKDRIGSCALIPSEVRAPIATLEFQEYRIRAAVANLRIGRRERLRLSEQMHDTVVEFLMNWRDDDRPKWSDVSDYLSVEARDLIKPSIDEEGGTNAPHDRTRSGVEKQLKKKTPLREWWDSAIFVDQAEFVDFLTDLSGQDFEPSSNVLAELISDDAHVETLEKITMAESGRAAYSRIALQKLNDVMREKHCDVHVARKIAFDVADDWQPPKPTFNDIVGHPTVDRVNVVARRFLSTSMMKWGEPEIVAIEHVRTAFMGPTGRAALLQEIGFNTRKRDKQKAELVSQGIQNASNVDVRRLECITLQNGMCLYCGTALTMMSCELDHIVPRASGGSNRRDNLVAVCRECNKEKGRDPFPVFAARTHRNGVSVEEAKLRVRAFSKGSLTVLQLKRLQRDISKRLSLETDDEEGMDRSIESTAYAARELRKRIESLLGITGTSISDPGKARVVVYQGIVTSEARKAGEVDGILRLRSFTKKSRLDRRHHAIDAAVLTTLSIGVAKTLKDRAELASSDRFTGHDPGWKEYIGRNGQEMKQFTEWKKHIGALAKLLKGSVENDKVHVVRQLRLVPRVGAVHADTVQKLVHKNIGKEFSSAEIDRVASYSLFDKLSHLADDSGNLPEDSARHLALKLPADFEVDLFPSSAACLAVRGGAVEIGGSIKSARVYAWKTNSGFGFGMVRVYTAEFPKIGFLKSGIDIFTAPLPANSQAMRHASAGLHRRIESGEAKQIGWIAINDEIEIKVTSFNEGEEKLPKFLQACPENRWVIKGFFSSVQISIVPSYLAAEGIDDGVPEVVQQTLREGRIPTAVNVLLSDPDTTIIRRSVLGTVRWRHDGTSSSWNPHQAAKKIFG